MCGIFLSVSATEPTPPRNDLVEWLQARGPDSSQTHQLTTCSPSQAQDGVPTWHLTFYSTVLALRGRDVTVQPLRDEVTGSLLCWNGEAWQIDNQSIAGNDGLQVFRLLLSASKSSPDGDPDRILDVLTRITGPFAFIFYDAISRRVYYGRDRLGRRSLMISVDPKTLLISSIGTKLPPGAFSEVGTDAIICLELNRPHLDACPVPWKTPLPSINNRTTAEPSIGSTPSAAAVDALLLRLQDSLRLRVTDIPALRQIAPHINEAKVAVLFSGGLDCTLLARLSHDLLPADEAIDLLNVAFENPRSLASKSPTDRSSPYESCPDRVTGRASFAELQQVCPTRTWRFVAINVPFAEASSHRSQILRLMYPHNTEMDLSIAMALYFAARGQGFIASPTCPDPDRDINEVPHTTPARVLLSGLGADELFAGYTRHAAAFSRAGFPGLVDELELDWKRIGQRNLGRDDRVMSHWGREVRYPYLDETFTKWALELPAWEKCGFRVGPDGPRPLKRTHGGRKTARIEDLEPAKMLLRMAAWKMGMELVAGERKRAIQFGAKTAKMEVGKGSSKGTDIIAD